MNTEDKTFCLHLYQSPLTKNSRTDSTSIHLSVILILFHLLFRVYFEMIVNINVSDTYQMTTNAVHDNIIDLQHNWHDNENHPSLKRMDTLVGEKKRPKLSLPPKK